MAADIEDRRSPARTSGWRPLRDRGEGTFKPGAVATKSRPHRETRRDDRHDDAGLQVGVHVAGLGPLRGGVRDRAHDDQYDAVEGAQGGDDVADVEGTGRARCEGPPRGRRRATPDTL